MGTLVNQSADEGGGLPSPFLSWNTQINARCLEKTVVGGLPLSLCKKPILTRILVAFAIFSAVGFRWATLKTLTRDCRSLFRLSAFSPSIQTILSEKANSPVIRLTYTIPHHKA